jgi:hypothetical protein
MKKQLPILGGLFVLVSLAAVCARRGHAGCVDFGKTMCRGRDAAEVDCAEQAALR